MALVPVERGKHFCRAARRDRCGISCCRPCHFHIRVRQRGRTAPCYGHPVARLQSRTPTRRAGPGQRVGSLRARAIARALSLAIKVTSCVTGKKRNRKLQRSTISFWCGAQVGDYRSRDVRRPSLRSRITIRQRGDGDQTEDGNQAEGSDTQRKRYLNE